MFPIMRRQSALELRQLEGGRFPQERTELLVGDDALRIGRVSQTILMDVADDSRGHVGGAGSCIVGELHEGAHGRRGVARGLELAHGLSYDKGAMVWNKVNPYIVLLLVVWLAGLTPVGRARVFRNGDGGHEMPGEDAPDGNPVGWIVGGAKECGASGLPGGLQEVAGGSVPIAQHVVVLLCYQPGMAGCAGAQGGFAVDCLFDTIPDHGRVGVGVDGRATGVLGAQAPQNEALDANGAGGRAGGGERVGGDQTGLMRCG